MTENLSTETANGAAAPSVAIKPLSAGGMLRAAREASGLHIAALAVSMKVPVKKLEALEADRFDDLPDAVFVRALASSVCRTLKIDAASVLEKLPASGAQRLSTEERGLNAPFHAPGDMGRVTVPTGMLKPAPLLVIALLFGAVALMFVPETKIADTQSKQMVVSEQPTKEVFQTPLPREEAPNLPKTVVVSEPVQAVPVAQTVVSAPPVVTVSADKVIAVPPSAASSAPSGVKSDPQVVKTEDKATPQGVLIPNLVTLKAKNTAWVEVVDSKGAVQVRKTMVAGESITASGVAPLSVVVGRVDAIDVEVRGKPFSLVGIGIDNVARFEVK
jgi:cytoskeleton protein RodZ